MKKQFSGLFLLTPIIIAGAFQVFTSCKNLDGNKKETASEKKVEEKKQRKRYSGVEKQLTEWFWQKGYPNPANLTGKYLNAWEQFKEIKNNTPVGFASRLENLGNWTAFGPKVFGGRVLTLAISPTAAASGKRTIFAGSASGGIWKSYTEGDGATAWQPVVTGKNILGVASIAYHPTDSNIIIAGTGEVYRIETYTNGPNSSDQVGNIGRNVWKARGTYGIGILRSSNGGSSWSHVFIKTSADLFGIQKIVFDPTNANIVFACATDGLYKSTDAGITWGGSPIWPGTYVSDVAIDPANNQNIILAAGNVGNATKGVWKSTNGGTSFTQISAGSFPSAAKSGFRGDIKFAVAGSGSPYTLFASIGMNDIGSGYNVENEVYRSTDFGSTWTMITNSNHASYQSWFCHLVLPYPGSTTKLFMSGVNKYVLSIAGSTGTRTSIGTGSSSGSYLLPGTQEGTNYLHADVHDMQFLPGSSSVAFFATDGGIFKTTNAGASPITNMSFVSCNGGLQIQQFYPTVAQSKTGTTIIGGLQDNNVIRYNGTGWAKVIGGDGGPCMFKPDNENVALASNDTRGVSASTNNGASFPATALAYLGDIAVPHDDRTSFMAPIAVSPNSPNRWYVASDNLHVGIFNTGTSTFGTFNNGGGGVPSTNYIDALYKPAVSIGVSDLNASKLYISTSPFAQDIANDDLHYNPPARIRKSTDGGSTFSTVSAALPDRFVTDFAISSTNDDSVFVTLSGFGTTHIYVTGDGGTNWTPRGSGLPDVPFNTIMFDPNDKRIIYAGCDYGVYVSQDRGATWFDYNNGLWDATYVMDLTYATVASVKKLRAVTHGKGIFEADLWSFLTTLPVSFKSFNGINQGTSNYLTWITEQENNLSHYELQRSTDGFNYQVVKQVSARNASTQSSYNTTDFVGTNPAPVYYYRLRSLNFDGTYIYSDVVMIKISNKGKFEVLGNPFTSSLTFRFSALQTGKLQISLTDMQGRLVKKEETVIGAGSGTYSITNLSSIPSGIYLLNLEMDRQRTIIKVLKR